MTERERLIELIEQCLCHYSPPCTGECGECHNVEMYDRNIEHIADHLLANGVIVPPCKVGDVLYRIEEKHIEDDTYLVYEFMVDRQYVLNDKISIFVHRIWNGKTLTSYEVFENSDIGKTVFLTREEAEKAF